MNPSENELFRAAARQFIERSWRKIPAVFKDCEDAYPARITSVVEATVDGQTREFFVQIKEVSERAKAGAKLLSETPHHPMPEHLVEEFKSRLKPEYLTPVQK